MRVARIRERPSGHHSAEALSAKWLEAEGKGHLKPFGDEADRKAIEQLELTLAEAPDLSSLPEAVQKKLLKAAPGDFAKLWPAVEDESARHEKDAKKKLGERGEAEAKALTKILESQQEAIAEVLDRQLDLELVAKEEIDQFKRDKGHLEKRRSALEKELREQPEALKQIYDVRLARLSPVGMVYLWPSSR